MSQILQITPEIIALLEDAASVGREKGYRPYSNYPVAAAVLTVDGKVYGGCGNVESSNFTLTKHAEETATLAAMIDGAFNRCGRIFLRAVYLPRTSGEKTVICGGCRQFMAEFSDFSTEVIYEKTDRSLEFVPLHTLIPEVIWEEGQPFPKRTG